MSTGIMDGRKPVTNKGLHPRESLADFIRVVFGLEPARHHMEWIAALENEKDYQRLLIITPPGHAKTTVAGVAYPAWKLGNHPERHFLYYGNTQTQAEKQSTAIRDLVVENVYQSVFPGIRKSRTKGWAGHQWFLERPQVWDKDPSMLALGVDGPALGARADELLFDDVCDLQNMNTIDSRAKVRNQIAAVAFSRQGGKSRMANRMVAVMTRWHEDDLANFFEAEGFKVIWMPALGYWDFVKPYAEEHGPTKLADQNTLPYLAQLDSGKPLWEEEYDVEFFDDVRRNPDNADIWTLEYQGLTTKPGGNQFKPEHFQWYVDSEGAGETEKVLSPYNIRGIFQFWDTASKAKRESDFWCCETWAWASDGYYLLEVFQGKFEFAAGADKVKEYSKKTFAVRDEAGVPLLLQSRAVYVESTGTNNGQAVISTLGRERLTIHPIVPTDSKEERAGQAIRVMEDTPCYFPSAGTAYVGTTKAEFQEQHKSFPRGKHDDMVDTTSMSINHLRQYPILAEEAWKDRMAINTNLTKDSVPSGALMRRAGGSSGRVQRGHFGATRRSSYSDPSTPD